MSLDFLEISNDHKQNFPNFMNAKNLLVSNDIPMKIENKWINLKRSKRRKPIKLSRSMDKY